jgi:hypothetical protein
VLYGRFPEAPAKELSASLNQLLSALAASGITDPKELRHRAIEELVPRTAGRIALGPNYPSAGLHLDFAGLRFLHLGKCQRDDAIAHLGPHLVLIDPARNPEAPPVGTDIVFAVNRLLPVVLAEVDSTFDGERTGSAGLLLSAGTASPRTKLFVMLGVLRSPPPCAMPHQMAAQWATAATASVS